MFDAYKISVKLTLVNGVSAGLAGLAMQFQRLNKDADKTQSSLGLIHRQMLEIKRLGMVGGAMAVAGGFGLALFKGPIQAASEYERAYTRFKTLNLGDVINKQADRFARGTQAFGASSTQLMETLRETYGFFGDMGIAQAASKKIAELNAANSNLFQGKIGAIDGTAATSLMRFADMRGATNSLPDFLKTLDLAQRMVTGSGGAMKFGDLEQFAKRGGTAFKAMSDEGIMMMATVMQEMGGSSAGTGLMSAYQNLVAGRTTKKAMAALHDLGLAKLGYVTHGDIGGKEYKTLQIVKMKNAKLLRENFPQWIMQTVLPQLERRKLSLPQQAAVVNDLLSNRTGSNLGVTFATQFIQTLRDKKLVEGAMGVDQTIEQNKNTVSGKFGDLMARWNDLLMELGVIVLPTVIKATEGLIGILKSVKEFAKESPFLTKGLVLGFGALAGVLAVGGVLITAIAATRLAFFGLGGVLGGGVGGAGGGLAGGVSSLAGSLKVLGIAAAPLLAMLAVKEWAEDKSHDKERTETLMSWSDKLKSWMPGFMGDPTKSARERYMAARRELDGSAYDYVRPKQTQLRMINNTIVLPDGRVLAKVVTQEQSKEASRPQAGASRFDGRMTPAHVGATGRW